MKKLLSLPILCLSFWVNAQTVTRVIADSTSTRAALPALYAQMGNDLYFTAKHETNTSNYALYKTDGTDAGTVMVSALSDNNYQPRSVVSHNGYIIFENYDNSGWEPWVSDGTSAGTKLLKEIKSGSVGGGFAPIGKAGNTLYFTAVPSYSAIWKTDGTTTGTVEVIPNVNVSWSIMFKDKVYYWGTVSGVFGLYSIDATGNNTLIKKLTSANYFNASIAIGSNKFYFPATDSLHGIEPWVSDGTTAGTMMIKDCVPGTLNSLEFGSGFTSFEVLNDILYFNPLVSGKRSIWKSDGTEAGTESFYIPTLMNPQRFRTSGNKMYFVLENPDQIGVTDGTLAGTVIITPTTSNTGAKNFGYFIPFKNKVFFAGISAEHPEYGQEPWISDGSANGTFMIEDINPQAYSPSVDFGGSISSLVTQIGQLNGKLYFAANDKVNGPRLWVLDDVGSSGLKAISLNYSVSVYPNPSSAFINIDSKETDLHIQLMNACGEKVLETTNAKHIDISQLSTGIYLIEVQTKQGVYRQKLIKE